METPCLKVTRFRGCFTGSPKWKGGFPYLLGDPDPPTPAPGAGRASEVASTASMSPGPTTASSRESTVHHFPLDSILSKAGTSFQTPKKSYCARGSGTCGITEWLANIRSQMSFLDVSNLQAPGGQPKPIS